MNEIQSALTKKLNENKITKPIMPFGSVLVYVYIACLVIELIMSFVDYPSETLMDVLAFVGIFTGFVYLAGLIFCYAKNDFTTILVAFGVKTLNYFIGIIKYLTNDYITTTFTGLSNYLVNIAVYAILAYLAYTQFAKTRVPATYRPMGAAPATKFCPSCGKPNPVEAPFCNNCGNKFMQ